MKQNLYDTSVRPQDDFFGYINNPWLAQNPIPATENVWGTFYILRDKAWQALHDIVIDLQNSPSNDSSSATLKTYFECAMNFDAHSDNHRAYIQKLFADIDDLSTPEDIARMIGTMHRRGHSAFWMYYVDLDDKDSRNQVIRLQQSGLTLPNRDYYLDKSDKMKEIRSAYERYHHASTTHINEKDVDYETLFDTEKMIAGASWTDAELRDVEKTYNPVPHDKLAITYDFPWQEYFKGLGWEKPAGTVIVGQPSYLKKICDFLRTADSATIKTYLKWRVLANMLPWVDNRSAQISFDFFGTVLGGTKEMKPLWKRTILLADRLIIGEVLGREYAKRHFPPASKKAVEAIVEDIRQAYHARIDRLDWMSDQTKISAHQKLSNIKVFIGYPSSWKDLSPLSLTTDNHLRNIIAINEYETLLELRKVGQPPLKEEWFMNAHTVNAYNHPNRLEIVFPAAILQPPFYDPQQSYAANLGGIGAVIGHELTHGFDDQGAQFDKNGNLNPWQSHAERTKFDKKAQNIVDLADAFESTPGTYLQGKLILGEAIADIGGLALALEALDNSRNQHTISQKDYTAQCQELFENFAQCECGHATAERLVELAKTDPHPPSPFRVNCVVNHHQVFYDTYSVLPGDKLYLPIDKRASIW